MHASVMRWVSQKVAEHDLSGRSVIEIGSLDVNGSVRDFFSGVYVGVDIRPGPGVDKVVEAGILPFTDESFGVVVSTECMEHDLTFWETMREIGRVLQPQGWLILTTRGFGFPLHEHPKDYYRFTSDAVAAIVEEVADLDIVEVTSDPQDGHPGVLCLAQKARG